MGDDRNRILDLLAAGRITAEEAARLLDALVSTSGQPAEAIGSAKGAAKTGSAGPPKFLYVKVVSVKGDNVNIKIPLSLVRAGLKLTSLIPPHAADQINKSMAEKGMSFDLASMKPEDLEDVVESLREMEINVDSNDGDTVRVYAE
ncbi:MAG TPA: hypothetical protein VJP78_10200 [Thermoleophilia bacterium]|nr:hypothetical protein [Thermoleophilia bacterium]